MSHKRNTLPANKQQMQCLMTWHLETERHERRLDANANAAEMKDTDMEDKDEGLQ